MYKARTSEDWKSHFGFANDYEISGFMSYGAWDVEKHFRIFEGVATAITPDVRIKRLSGFLSNIIEVILGDRVYWFTVSYGGVQLSEYLHLACLFGSKKNIHIGSCGGLHPDANSLDWIIPTYSYGNESTLRIYGRESKDNKYFPDKVLSELLKSKIPSDKTVFSGPIVTCLAMMGETFEDIQSWSNEGYFGVEMETATVFSVSRHFNVPAASLVYISDNLIKGQTAGDESHVSQKNEREKMKKNLYNIGIQILTSI